MFGIDNLFDILIKSDTFGFKPLFLSPHSGATAPPTTHSNQNPLTTGGYSLSGLSAGDDGGWCHESPREERQLSGHIRFERMTADRFE